ncbi:DsbA family protein [Patescibacteria group bacterium]|nr:DsbA family protein [Patescibacteria group bacterium]
MEDEKGMFSKMSPKTGFFAGLGSAFIVFFVIGFFVLLAMVVQGDKDAEIADNDKNNPEVAGEEAQVPSAQDLNFNPAPLSENDWVRGKSGAQITLIEYSDIECPFCSKFHETTKQVLEEYPDDVKLVYRHLPLPSLHPNAPKDAEATECAGELGGNDMFWRYLDTLYNSDLSSVEQLTEIAVGMGLDRSAFDSCLRSGKHAEKVRSNSDDGAQAADTASYMDNDPSNDGRWGTPFSVIISGDQKIPVPGAYPIDYLRQIIDSLLVN